MKIRSLFLYSAIFTVCCATAWANVATTAGSNLTAYNGTGATNNNKWNTMMNTRSGIAEPTATANFGNCNAVILRCATPKCANGACYDMSVARPIVAGCVNSNNSCKKHGDDLIEYITAQIVAQSTAKQQEQANAVAIAQAEAQAQAAAAQNAAAQSNAQMQQMQQQMAEMQAQMAESMAAMQEQMTAQSESQSAQIQTLAEQRNSYYADGGAATTTGGNSIDSAALEGLSAVEQIAVKNGVDANLLVREQVSGKIETAITDAETEMKHLKQTLDDLLEYAGCDSAATNCTGPKRVKKFKDLANQFFDPYEGVVDNMYDALMLALTVGIDVNDVIMLLSDSCNMWGQYLCGTCTQTDYYKTNQTNNVVKYDPEYTAQHGRCECNYTTDANGQSTISNNCYWRVATTDGQVAKKQQHCRLMGIIDDKITVQRDWIEANTGLTGSTQVACASDVVLSAALFRGRSKQAKIDIENLRGLVNQDAYPACRRNTSKGDNQFDVPEDCGTKFCMVNRKDGVQRWKKLEDAVRSKKLGKYCYKNEREMSQDREDITTSVISNGTYNGIIKHTGKLNSEPTKAELDADPSGKRCREWFTDDWCYYYYNEKNNDGKDNTKASCRSYDTQEDCETLGYGRCLWTNAKKCTVKVTM